MSFISILLFLLKYGPAIFQLIKSAIELIRWLRENDETTVAFDDVVSVKAQLDGMAKRCKIRKDNSELRDFVNQLQKRKAEVERRRKGG